MGNFFPVYNTSDSSGDSDNGSGSHGGAELETKKQDFGNMHVPMETKTLGTNIVKVLFRPRITGYHIIPNKKTAEGCMRALGKYVEGLEEQQASIKADAIVLCTLEGTKASFISSINAATFLDWDKACKDVQDGHVLSTMIREGRMDPNATTSCHYVDVTRDKSVGGTISVMGNIIYDVDVETSTREGTVYWTLTVGTYKTGALIFHMDGDGVHYIPPNTSARTGKVQGKEGERLVNMTSKVSLGVETTSAKSRVAQQAAEAAMGTLMYEYMIVPYTMEDVPHTEQAATSVAYGAVGYGPDADSDSSSGGPVGPVNVSGSLGGGDVHTSGGFGTRVPQAPETPETTQQAVLQDGYEFPVPPKTRIIRKPVRIDEGTVVSLVPVTAIHVGKCTGHGYRSIVAEALKNCMALLTMDGNVMGGQAWGDTAGPSSF